MGKAKKQLKNKRRKFAEKHKITDTQQEFLDILASLDDNFPLKLNDGDGNPLLDGITAPAKFWKDMYGLNKIDLSN